MEVFNLDLIPGRSNPVIHCSQFDEGRTFRANLFEGSSVYTLTGAETLTLIEKKLDGNMVTISVTNTSDSYVEFATTQQMTALEGEQLCELRIENGGVLIGTLNFLLDCEPSPDTGIASDSAIHNLEAQIAADVAFEVANQYDSANVIFDNLPTAGHGIPHTVTSEGIGNAIDNALEMTAEASGAIANFESEYALPLRDLEIEINAVQESGTPTPSSPKAISGFTGANITNHSKNYLDTSTNVNGKALSATGAQTSIAQACYTDLIKVVVGEKYTFGATSALVDAWNRRIHGYDASGNWVQEIMNSNLQSYAVGTPFTMTFTVPSGISYIRISYYKDTNAQLEKGESASAYQAYNSTTTAITWQSEAGTVYGGSLDVTSGVLTVTWVGIAINSVTWYYSSGNAFFYCPNANLPNSRKVAGGIICECYTVYPTPISSTSQIPSLPDKQIYYNTSNGNIDIKDTDYTNETAFVNGVGNNMIIYEVETPVTYQLTPTQISAIVGTNNVFTDTNGDTSLEYYAGHGEETAQVAEEIAGVVVADYTAKVVKTKNGTFTNLLTSPLNSVWLICCQKTTTAGSGFVGIYSFDGVNLNPCVVYINGLSGSFDSATGTITVKYSGSTTDVYGSAFRLA